MPNICRFSYSNSGIGCPYLLKQHAFFSQTNLTFMVNLLKEALFFTHNNKVQHSETYALHLTHPYTVWRPGVNFSSKPVPWSRTINLTQPTCFDGGGNRRKPMQREHAPIPHAPDGTNLGPECYKVTVLTAEPPCCCYISNASHRLYFWNEVKGFGFLIEFKTKQATTGHHHKFSVQTISTCPHFDFIV